MSVTLGSLFDGSGGFPLAGSLCGIEPIWASEVEPYPIAVTKSRFPIMKHLGDISKVSGAKIEPVDIITFGSPCQDLSIAGKRAGLKHETNGDEETTRSGLFMEAIRIIKEMRRATNGKYPRFALWENVPGAFSSNKGEDFRIVLEELVKISEAKATMPPAPKSGWPYADTYMGDGWSIAYRTFDAQYWGVPQRRRRIYLVADFIGGCAPGILFEREGLRGYFTEGKSPWKRTTARTKRSVRTNDCKNKNTEIIADIPLAAVASTIRAGAGAPKHLQDCVGRLVLTPIDTMSGLDGYNGVLTGDKSSTLGVNCGMSTGRNGVLTTEPLILFEPRSQDGVPRIHEEVSPTLNTARGGQRQPCVAVPVYCVQGNCIDRADTAGCNGKGWREDASFTLNTIDRPAVAYATSTGSFMQVNKELSPTLAARDYKDPHLVCYEKSPQTTEEEGNNYRSKKDTQTYSQSSYASYTEGIGGTLTASGGSYGGGSECLIVEDKSCSTRGFVPLVNDSVVDGTNQKQVAPATLEVGDNLGFNYIVRRLTPTECARLQGFADDWGVPEHKDELTDEEYKFWLQVRNTHATINGRKEKEYTKAQMLSWYNKLHSDSSEYKMWGNGVALPPTLYCMQGISDALRVQKPYS